jgi:hypothetical protein
MYLVTSDVFLQFVKHEQLPTQIVFDTNQEIIEFKRNSILMAKVETKSIKELKMVLRSGAPGGKSVNKYWIRGDEWKQNSDKTLIPKLTINRKPCKSIS